MTIQEQDSGYSTDPIEPDGPDRPITKTVQTPSPSMETQEVISQPPVRAQRLRRSCLILGFAIFMVIVLGFLSALYFELIPGINFTMLMDSLIRPTPTSMKQIEPGQGVLQTSSPAPRAATTQTPILLQAPVPTVLISTMMLPTVDQVSDTPYPSATPMGIRSIILEGSDDLFSVAGRYIIDYGYLMAANQLRCYERPLALRAELFIPPPEIEKPSQPLAELSRENLNNLENLKLLRILDCMNNVRDLAFSPDGQTLAVARDNSVYLWRVRDWKPFKPRLRKHQSLVTSLTFSPDGSQLAVGEEHGEVCVYLLSDLENPKCILAHKARVTDVTFSQDNRYLVTTSVDQYIKKWPLPSMQYPKVDTGFSFFCAVFSPDYTYLAVCAGTKILYYDFNTFTKTVLLPSEFVVYNLAFSNNGILLATNANLWQAKEGQLIETMVDSSNTSKAQVVFSPDGNLIFVGSTIFNSIDGSTFGRVPDPPVAPSSESPFDEDKVTVNPDGTLLVWANRDAVAVYAIPKSSAIAATPGTTHTAEDGDTYFNIAKKYNVDLARLLAMNRNPQCHNIYNGKTLQIPSEPAILLQLSSTRITPSNINQLTRLASVNLTCAKDLGDISFSPDSSLMASGATLWDLSRGSVLIQEKNPALNRPNADGIVDPAPVMAFSPDGKFVAVRSGSDIGLWDALTGRKIRDMVGNGNLIAGLAFSQDPSLLLLASGTGVSKNADEIIRIWRVDDGEILHEIKGYSAKNLTFTPDNKRLLVAWEDETIRFYNLETRKWEEPLMGVEGRYDLSPDGTRLAYIGCEQYDGDRCIEQIVIIYNIETGVRESNYGGIMANIQDVVYGADRMTLYIASSYAIKRLDPESGLEIGPPLDPGSQDRALIKELYMSPDHTILIARDEKNVLRFWQVPVGSLLHTIKMYMDNLAFSQDMTLMAFLYNGQVGIWGIP